MYSCMCRYRYIYQYIWIHIQVDTLIHIYPMPALARRPLRGRLARSGMEADKDTINNRKMILVLQRSRGTCRTI